MIMIRYRLQPCRSPSAAPIGDGLAADRSYLSANVVVSDSSTNSLADGIRYLRGGSLERARLCFEEASLSREPQIRTEALRRLADVKRRRAEWDEAMALAQRAASIAAEHGLPDDEAAAMNIHATIHLQRGEVGRALEVYQAALTREPDPLQQGLICQNLGTAYAQHGRLDEATEWYARSSDNFRIAGRRREALLARINQGNVQLDRGQLAAAEEIYRDALDTTSALPSPDAELQGLLEMNLAEALGRQGKELDHAMTLILSATGHFASASNRPYLLACYRVLALVSERRGELETAVSALEHGRRLAHEIESGPELAHYDRELSRLNRHSNDSSARGSEAQ